MLSRKKRLRHCRVPSSYDWNHCATQTRWHSASRHSGVYEGARFIPGKHEALDGFYKHPDGTVSTMPSKEFCELD
jgi:hypothetical protein